MSRYISDSHVCEIHALQNFETSCTARRFSLHDFQIRSNCAPERVSGAQGLKRFTAWIQAR